MHRCPYCGAEFSDTAERCPQCDTAAAEPDFSDPFTAALLQEQSARAEQERRRTSGISLYDHPPAALPVPPPLPAEPEPPEPPQKKRRFLRALPFLISAAMFALTFYTGYSLMFGDVHADEPDFSYVFYQKDDRLCFCDRGSGRISVLASGGESDALKQDLYASLVQVSADGSRVLYPKDIRKDGTCIICYRQFSDMDTEYKIAEISVQDCSKLQLSHEFVDGNPDQSRPEHFVNMSPAYLLIGDVLFYRNAWRQLCRKPIGGEEEVLAEEVVRWWSIPDCENVYYLTPQDYAMLKHGNDERAADFVSSFEDGCSVCEEIAAVSCDLWYCTLQSEPCDLAWNVRSWNVPAADSARYFHYLYQPDKYSAHDCVLMQVDLLHPERAEAIWFSDIEGGFAYVLRCYPDGSFYFVSSEINEDTHTAMRKAYYFSRKQDYLCSVTEMPCGEGETLQSWFRVCRDEPYLVRSFTAWEDTDEIFFFKDEAVPLSGLDAQHDILLCRFSYYGTRLYIRKTAGETMLYSGVPAGKSVPTMQPVSQFDYESLYFSVPVSDETLFFRLNDRQLVRCTEFQSEALETIDVVNCAVYPQYGQMYCLSDYYRKRAVLNRIQSSAGAEKIAEGVADYLPADADKLFLLLSEPDETHGELFYDCGDFSVRLDADVTALLAAGIRNTDI